MAKTQELSVQESRELIMNPVYQTVKAFEMQQRMAQMYVQSTIVPQAYRGNIGNCVIAIDMAQRMQANPLMVMQNLYIVNGNPAWSSKFLISCINMCGRFTPLRYQFTGKKGTKEYGCRAYAYEKSDKEHKEPLCSVWITMEMADREGWTKKSGSKWLTMPDQMLAYRAAAFWSRIYAPEISMGFLTKEEIDDAAQDVAVDVSMAGQDAGLQAGRLRTQLDAGEVAALPGGTEPKDAIAAAMARQAKKTTHRGPEGGSGSASARAKEIHEKYMAEKAAHDEASMEGQPTEQAAEDVSEGETAEVAGGLVDLNTGELFSE